MLAGDPQETDDLVGLGLPPLFALVGAVVISGLFGLAFAPVAGRLRGIYLGVASLSLVFLGLWLGQSLETLTGGTSSGRPAPTFELFGFPFTNASPRRPSSASPSRSSSGSGTCSWPSRCSPTSWPAAR